MTFTRILLNIYVFLVIFLIKFNISCLAMNTYGSVDDDDAVNPAIVQQQLIDLQPFGVELKNNILNVSLKDDNPTDLGITLASSRELVAHYDAHLDYFTPLSRGHLRLLRCFPRLVSLKIHNQTLDASKGTILGEILNQHKSRLTALDLSSTGSLKLTDDGLVAVQQGISALPHVKILTLHGQNNLSSNGKSILSNILSNIISVEQLDLSHINIGPQAENQVLGPCSKLTNLNKINVSNNNLGGDFLVFLKPLPNLIDLNISNNQIIGKKLRCLPKFTSRNHLKLLNMAHNQIDDEGFTYISLLPNLTKLNISNNNTTDEGVNEITELQSLTFLDICNNKLSEKGATVLLQNSQIELGIEALQMNSNNKFLDLKGNKLGPVEILALAKNTILTSLDLGNTNIGDAGAQAFSQNTTLTNLYLKNNNIGDVGVQALAKNTTLTELDLGSTYSPSADWNRIGAMGAQVLARNTTLTSLNLYGSKISNAGIPALAQNTTLISLSVSPWDGDNNDLYSASDIAIAVRALAQNTTLISLKLGCRIEPEGSEVLAKNTTLRSLDLANCNVRMGVQFFAKNTTLTSLNLEHNFILDEWVKPLVGNTTLTFLNLRKNFIPPGFRVDGCEGRNALAQKVGLTITY